MNMFAFKGDDCCGFDGFYTLENVMSLYGKYKKESGKLRTSNGSVASQME